MAVEKKNRVRIKQVKPKINLNDPLLLKKFNE